MILGEYNIQYSTWGQFRVYRGSETIKQCRLHN
jgi:hypothetical protein